MLCYIRLYYHPKLFWIRYPENQLSLYVNYRASSFVFCFLFLKNKELLIASNECLIGRDFSAKRSVSVSYKLVSYVQDYCILDVSINLDWLTLKV